MLWHAVVQLYWATLVKLVQWSAPRSALLTCANNIALPGFIYFYTCLLNVSLHRIIISIHFPLIYAIWWALTHITWSQRCAFSFTTHTYTAVISASQWGDKHTNNISRTALRVTSWACIPTIYCNYTQSTVFATTRSFKGSHIHKYAERHLRGFILK